MVENKTNEEIKEVTPKKKPGRPSAKKTTAKKAPVKKTTTRKTVTKPKVEEVEEVVEVVEETVESKLEDKIAKAKIVGVSKGGRKVFDEEDMVQVASIATGRVTLKNPEKPYDVTEFERFFTIEPVRYGTLSNLRKKGTETFSKLLYILDDEVSKTLGLTKIYNDMGKIEDIIGILEGDTDDIIKFIDTANKATKTIITQILFSKIENKEKLDYFKTKILSEKLGIELNLDF